MSTWWDMAFFSSSDSDGCGAEMVSYAMCATTTSSGSHSFRYALTVAYSLTDDDCGADGAGCLLQVMAVVVVPGGLWLCSIHPVLMAVVLCFLPPSLYFLAR